MSKKFAFIVVLFVLVTFWYFAIYSREHPQKITPVPVASDLTLYVQPDSGRSAIEEAIKNARFEILMEIYLLSDREIIDAIESAHDRGVAVNIIIECHPFGGGNINKKTIDELNKKRINNKCASKNFALTHEKAVVVDASLAFIMTQNLTNSSFEKNREYDVRDADKKDVDEIRNIFLDDWKESSFIPTLNSIIESPNNSRAAITNLINSASQEIDIEMEIIDDTQIVGLLSKRAHEIKVNVILPTIKQINANKKSIDSLRNAGANVRVITDPYMHAKMILVDERRAYVGSINLTSASIDENRELGIILSQQDVTDKLQMTFFEDWSKAID